MEDKTEKETSLARHGEFYSNKQLTTEHYYKNETQQTAKRDQPAKLMEEQAAAFHERVDRHGNRFGARVATKQTRIPSQPRASENWRRDPTSWRNKGADVTSGDKDYNSPSYTIRDAPLRMYGTQRKQPFPQRGLSEWRLKPANPPRLTAPQTAPPISETQNPAERNNHLLQAEETANKQTEEQIISELNEETLRYMNCPDPTEAAARRHRVMASDARGQTELTAANLLALQRASSEQTTNAHSQPLVPAIPSKDQILQELHEVTKQYLSCADPVEAAARHRRVLEGDAEGLMEQTADSILAATITQRRPLSPWQRGIRSESPPGIDFNEAMQPSDVELTPPPVSRGLVSKRLELSPPKKPSTPRSKRSDSTRLQSIIVSPTGEQMLRKL
ncbi:Uncharacterized protein Rs2_38741 [Raphanus sativus]|nr:Uncharacterized protein Rs2_38741 [Raphanus sativus]